MTGLSEQVREWVAAAKFWHLATVNRDGSPHVSPMWIDVEGEYIVFNTAVGRVKEENLRHDPRVSLSCMDSVNPYDRVVVHGRVVEFVEGDEAEQSMDRLAKKYVGTDRFEWRIPGERRVKILVEPTRARHVVGVEPFRRGAEPGA
ncbi:PPOX class F420-dependent oxidoreductase [Amycolatopsis sp. NPDC089917]|uniref:PPOX class F420-dependent oxidoreductase n=1 Tax=Amycolatopsis sp. NPDC089917 TaxID=3155187 RepID=UPI003446A73B